MKTLEADWDYLLKRLDYSDTKGNEKTNLESTRIYLGEHQPDFEEWERLKNLCPCKDPQAWVWRQTPGQMTRLHTDDYLYYRQLTGRYDDILTRWWIPFSDRQPGQFLEIEGQLIDWKAGDLIELVGVHGTATVGTTPRYCLLVTGVK